jgi:hypothetical protein
LTERQYEQGCIGGMGRPSGIQVKSKALAAAFLLLTRRGQPFATHHQENHMPVMEKIDRYSVQILHNDVVDYGHVIRLELGSGGTAFIAFPAVRPANWLVFSGSSTNLFLTRDQYADVYHVLQSERPVFFTALNVIGIRAAAVHTELNLSLGEPTGEGEQDGSSLESLIRRAQLEGDGSGAA